MITLSNLWESVLSTTAFRAAAVVVAVFSLVAALIMWFVSWETNRVMTRQALVALKSEVTVLRSQLRGQGLDGLAREIELRSTAGGPGLYYLGQNNGVWLAGNLQSFPIELRNKKNGGVFQYSRKPAQAPGADGRGLVLPGSRMAVGTLLPYENAVVVVARDVDDQRVLSRQIRLVSLLGFGFLGIAGLLAGFAMSRIVLARVDSMTAASRTIMAGDLSKRLVRDGSGDEFDKLAQNFNEMLGRIEQLMHGMREVSDNIAHDLKTPLNRLRIRAEEALRDPRGAQAQRKGLERTIEAADDLMRTFNALLLIARLEAGAIEETLEEVDVSAVVFDVAELYEPVAGDVGLSLKMSGHRGDTAMAFVNRQLVGQSVANLIDNAIKYSVRSGELDKRVVDVSAGVDDQADEPVGGPNGGTDIGRADIDVSVTVKPEGIEISVGDRGPGIDPADRERVLKRFVRLERSRTAPGTGLGLSLVAAVARLHGGHVRLEDNAPGLRVVLVLPRDDIRLRRLAGQA